jgi:crotonobetainyl-CoA:carnitine CoA-transferase CaiB-like acyl-CoA transferase
VRILDLTRIVAGPYGTSLLAELGARVLKVEQPETGDEIRLFPDQVRGLSVTFNDLNRNKESLTLDLRTERGQESTPHSPASARTGPTRATAATTSCRKRPAGSCS